MLDARAVAGPQAMRMRARGRGQLSVGGLGTFVARDFGNDGSLLFSVSCNTA